jgi:chromosome partitioning protein
MGCGVKIITIASQKGGVGKSLLARALAVTALGEGRRAGILDADPQGSCVKWSGRRPYPAPTVRPVGQGGLKEALDAYRTAGADLVIIDTPPHARPVVSLAAELADYVLIPVKPYPDDLEALGATVEIVRAIKCRAGIVINMTAAKSSALTMARAALATFDLPICPTNLVERLSHPYAIAEGMTASEREPASKAAAEIAAVWEWVKFHMKEGK